MQEYNIQYACVASTDGNYFHPLGSDLLLIYPELPKRFFGSAESIGNLVSFLESNLLPQMMSQGDVKSVMGFSKDKKFVYSLFLNSKYNAKEHYVFAKKIHDEITCCSSDLI